MLEARFVTVRREGRTLLDTVSTGFEPGQLTAIVGPNGAGKTTLLRVLTGEARPDAGDAVIDGRAIRSWPRQALARRMAVVPQASRIAFDFLVSEVVALGRTAHAHSSSKARDDRLVSEALDEVGLAGFASRRYPTLSGGERQRVHLARALVQIAEPAPASPPVLLLDEPTSALDLAQQRIALQAARRRALAGAMVVTVLHDLNLALAFADRLLVLRAGQVVASGMPADLVTETAVSDWYGCPVRMARTADASLAVCVGR